MPRNFVEDSRSIANTIRRKPRRTIIFFDVLWKKEYFLLGIFNPLSANPGKWSNTLKQIVGNLPTICLSVFDHFINLALKGLTLNNNLLALSILVSYSFIFQTRCGARSHGVRRKDCVVHNHGWDYYLCRMI